jgi:predicted DNA-binding transcriptional regulator YafY
LSLIYQAITSEGLLEIRFRLPFGTPTEVTQTVEPLGLVARGGEWHLVYCRNAHIRARGVHTLEQVRRVPGNFVRPPAFELVRWWHEWIERRDRRQAAFVVVARLAAGLVQQRAGNLGPARILDLEQPDADDRQLATLAYSYLAQARTHLLGLGNAAEVLSPPALRRSIQDFAQQVARLYEPVPPTDTT